MRRPRAPTPHLLPLVGFVALFGLVPALLLFADGWSQLGLGGAVAALSDPLNLRALENSLVQGSLSAIAAVVVGYPVGVLLGRYAWAGQSTARALLIVPFLLPTLVVVLGVEDLFGPTGVLSGLLPALGMFGSGVPGIVAVNVAYNAPLVALLTAVGIESAPADLEETVATLGGSRWQRYRIGWGPASWRGALAGGLLAFVFSALAFAAPLLLCGARCYTLEARVWALAQVLLSPAEAAVVASIMTLLLLAPLAVYLLLVLRPTASGPGRFRQRPSLPWRSPSAWPLLGASIGVLGTFVLLLGSVLYRGLTATAPGGAPGSAWAPLFGSSVTRQLGISTAGALGNSLFFAAAAATIAVLLGVIAGFRRPSAREAGLRAYLFLPLLVSPIVLSFGLATFWRPLLGGNGSVWLLIVLSQATLGLPFALQGLDVALASVSPRLRESVETLGATPFVAYLEAELPTVRPAVVAAGLFAFALGLGEFTATYFLATPSFTTVPVEMYRLEGLRLPGLSDALAALLVVVSLVTFAALQRVGGRVLA
jgi:thiamine transport system permease protein